MTKAERENWIVNIQNSASVITSQLGSAVVESVLARYGVKYEEQLSSSDLPEVFSELFAIEADLN